MTTPPPLLLASTSPYRRALLERIIGGFEVAAPAIEEIFEPDEPPAEAATRLARLKALDCARRHPEALVIGGDQVPTLHDRPLRKPGSPERAAHQLRECSGQSVVFHTAVAVAGPGDAPPETHVNRTTVRFRALDEAEIQRYLEKDQPYDCAGSFKAESLGIALFSGFESEDPTAIQGLPLIWLSDCLRRRGFLLP